MKLQYFIPKLMLKPMKTPNLKSYRIIFVGICDQSWLVASHYSKGQRYRTSASGIVHQEAKV